MLLLVAIDFERAHVCTLATYGLDEERATIAISTHEQLPPRDVIIMG